MTHRPGSRWRFLAHTQDPTSGHPIEASSQQHPSIFDELVVDRWLHVEQMDHAFWWLAISCADGSELVVNVEVGADGRARDVLVETELSDTTRRHGSPIRFDP